MQFDEHVGVFAYKDGKNVSTINVLFRFLFSDLHQ